MDVEEIPWENVYNRPRPQTQEKLAKADPHMGQAQERWQRMSPSMRDQCAKISCCSFLLQDICSPSLLIHIVRLPRPAWPSSVLYLINTQGSGLPGRHPPAQCTAPPDASFPVYVRLSFLLFLPASSRLPGPKLQVLAAKATPFTFCFWAGMYHKYENVTIA